MNKFFEKMLLGLDCQIQTLLLACLSRQVGFGNPTGAAQKSKNLFVLTQDNTP
jgi:hypothetical protein